MKACRFCGKPLQQDDAVCIFCGYDPKTDALDQSFQPQAKEVKKQRKKLEAKEEKEKMAERQTAYSINPRIKKFALFGLVLVVFSIFYKYNFNLRGVVFEINNLFDRLNIVKFVQTISGKKTDKVKGDEKIELINVRNFEEPKRITPYKDLVVEGICFDSAGKSFATINGRVIAEGDSFENVTVKKINRDSVELMVDGEAQVLGINQSIPWNKKK